MSHPRRLKAYEYRGQKRVFITTCTWNKRAVFDDEAICSQVASQLLNCASAAAIEVTAYCVMRDHVHALLRGTSDVSDPLRMISRWKQITGYWCAGSGNGRLWQAGFWDRALRGDDDPAYYLHYTVMNPVRAGLTRSASEYRWLGSTVLTREELIEAAAKFESGVCRDPT